MVTSCHGSHHAGNLNLSLVIDNRFLFNFASANQRHGMCNRTKWCKRHLIPKGSHICENRVAKGVISNTDFLVDDSKVCAQVGCNE